MFPYCFLSSSTVAAHFDESHVIHDFMLMELPVLSMILNCKMRLLSNFLLLLLAMNGNSTIVLRKKHGTIKSPNYPGVYPDHVQQTWVIKADQGYQIVLFYTVFDLENSFDQAMGGACVYDYVEIDGVGNKPMRICGNSIKSLFEAPRIGQKFRSKENQMKIKFKSDYSNEEPYMGFQAHYAIEDKNECIELEDKIRNTVEDWDQVIYCNHFCHNTPGSYYCSCRSGFQLHSNGHTCIAVCSDQQLTSDSGEIRSPEFPHLYPKLSDCSWTIQVRSGLSLNFYFDKTFEIEDHYNETDCPYDRLKLTYGNHIEVFCGNLAPYSGQIIRTNGRIAKFAFHTDYAIEKAGFRVTYNTTRVRCNRQLTAPAMGNISHNPLLTAGRSHFEFEDDVTFDCDKGYYIQGQQTITCQADGTWSNPEPTCMIVSCGYPAHLAVPYANLTSLQGIQYVYEDRIVVECIKWYEIQYGASTWTCNEHGRWVATGGVNKNPVCKPICGQKNPKHWIHGIPHISRGRRTAPYEYPWMAFLNFGSQPSVAASKGTCGGALISPSFVLTAAHCVTMQNKVLRRANESYVWLSVYDRKKDSGVRSNAIYIPVAEIIRHPEYNPTNPKFDNDFALLRLAITVLMNDTIRPICLPSNPSLLDEIAKGVVAGWGQTALPTDPDAHKLQHAKFPKVNNADCWENFLATYRNHGYQKVPNHLQITNNMFCAGSSLGRSGNTCEGDSGGPFMVEGNDNKFITYGVVSWGLSFDECGRSLSFSVFGKINAQVLQWIKDNAFPQESNSE